MSPKSRRRLEDSHVEEAMSSVRADSCRDLIADIRTGAANEYLRVKRHKQSELNYRCVSEDGTSGGPLSRAQKKKVDNHASAVASRCKQEFLVSEFESLLRRKLSEAEILTAACTQNRVTIAEQLRDLHDKDAEIASLRKQLAAFRSLPPEKDPTGHHSNPPPVMPASSGTIPDDAASQLPLPMPGASISSLFSRSALAPVPRFTSVHSGLAPPKPSTASLGSLSPPPTARSSKLTETGGAVVKSEDLNVFAGTHTLQHEGHVHDHRTLGKSSALESQDLGAEMDEIISAAGHSFDTSSHPLLDDTVVVSELSSKHMLDWDDRQRLHPKEILKGKMQSDGTNGMLNPVA